MLTLKQKRMHNAYKTNTILQDSYCIRAFFDDMWEQMILIYC